MDSTFDGLAPFAKTYTIKQEVLTGEEEEERLEGECNKEIDAPEVKKEIKQEVQLEDEEMNTGGGAFWNEGVNFHPKQPKRRRLEIPEDTGSNDVESRQNEENLDSHKDYDGMNDEMGGFPRVIPTYESTISCEICDQVVRKSKYLHHLQNNHRQMIGKSTTDMAKRAPLACTRCRDRFWTYEGLERHLVMDHSLVAADLLQKAQQKEYGGWCKHCGKQFTCNLLRHLVDDHQMKLHPAKVMYACDECSFKSNSSHQLETHRATVHPSGEKEENGKAGLDFPEMNDGLDEMDPTLGDWKPNDGNEPRNEEDQGGARIELEGKRMGQTVNDDVGEKESSNLTSHKKRFFH